MAMQIQPYKKQISSHNYSDNADKIQFNNLIDTQLRKFINSSKTNEKYRKTCLVENLELLQSVPYSSFKKYELQTTPRKTPRRQQKNYVNQAQKIQPTQFKDAHINKVEQWKSKLFTKKIKTLKPNLQEKFNRTGSLIQAKNIQQKYLGVKTNPYQTIAIHKSNSPKNDSLILFKTREGNSLVNNNAFMRKLKAKIQFYSLSTIISERKDANNSFSPNVSSIEPKYFPKNNASFYEKKSERTKSWTKNSKSIKFDQKKRVRAIQFDSCRPWSAYKGELINDLINII